MNNKTSTMQPILISPVPICNPECEQWVLLEHSIDVKVCPLYSSAEPYELCIPFGKFTVDATLKQQKSSLILPS